MEVVILLIVGGAIVFAVREHKRNASRYSGSNPKSYGPRTLTRETSSVAKPFDQSTAKQAIRHHFLSGRARIIDGDTIVIEKTQIRLFGIDAPELDHPYGKNAKWALIGLCKGKLVRAEILERDVHGRTVAKCYLPDGRDLSAEMVKRGWAIDWPKFSGGQYGHLEVSAARKKMWLADARQRGRMHVWEQFEERVTKSR
ncbi:MAG: thermonuclease family protein [Pseudomonadota bacterium]